MWVLLVFQTTVWVRIVASKPSEMFAQPTAMSLTFPHGFSRSQWLGTRLAWGKHGKLVCPSLRLEYLFPRGNGGLMDTSCR